MPRSFPLGVLDGAALPFKAVGLIARTPRLLGLALISAVVTSGVVVLLFITLWPLARSIAEHLVAGDGTTWSVVRTAGVVLLYVVLLVSTLLTVPHLVLAPLEDPLSEATEVSLGGFTPPPFSLGTFARGVVLSASHTLLRLVFLLGGVLVLLPLNLLPVVGSVAYAVVSFTWSAWWAASEYTAGPGARHHLGFFEVQRLLRRGSGATLGLGAVLVVLLWIPLVNFFLVPLAVVSGTLLYRGLAAPGGNAAPP
ncbi:MAG: EI24 domain-containing protein [Myxococcaceae bacterium]|nr:EI24 domain-containing protein [Myxococcaceae bacterium]